MKKALTIAGSDSGGGAGIQADLKTFSAFGVYGMSVITSVTAQNTIGVDGIYDLPAEFVELQLDAVLRDIGTDAVKTGMLSNSSIVAMLADRLRDREFRKSIIDPVMISKSKHFLLKPDARNGLKELIVPRAYLITPNVSEAQLIAEVEIHDEDDMKKAAKIIFNMGAKNVVIKGGHLRGDATDILYNRNGFRTFRQKRLPAKHTHGTGCTFASAVASCIALGMPLEKAVERAKAFVTRAIQSGLDIGQGTGPANHLFELDRGRRAEELRKKLVLALERLKKGGVAPLIPEVSSNLVYAIEDAIDPGDILGFPGRIFTVGEDIRTVAEPVLGGSSHMARVVMAARQKDRRIRSAMNLRFDEKLVQAFEAAGYDVAEFDRRREPKKVREKEGSSLEWGTSLVIKKTGKVPDVIFDRGAVGKEAMVRVLGKDPAEVARKILAAWKSCRQSFPA